METPFGCRGQLGQRSSLSGHLCSFSGSLLIFSLDIFGEALQIAPRNDWYSKLEAICAIHFRGNMCNTLQYCILLSHNEVWLCLAWPLPALLFWLAEYCARRRRVTADGSEGPEANVEQALLSPRPERTEREFNRLHPGRFRVMLASLEHSIPHLGCKAQAGGLGKVMNLVARHHPTDILMIHPKLKDLTYRRLPAVK